MSTSGFTTLQFCPCFLSLAMNWLTASLSCWAMLLNTCRSYGSLSLVTKYAIRVRFLEISSCILFKFYNTIQVQYSLFHFMTLSGAFRHFQTLSNSQWCNPHRYIKPIVVSMLEWVRVQWLLPMLYNPYRRFKQLNDVFWERKSSCTSCTYNTSRGWVCWLLWGELARETITWKSY